MNGTLKKIVQLLMYSIITYLKKNQHSRRRQLQAKLTFCGHEMFRN